MKKVLLVDDEERSEANYTYMKIKGINIHWEQTCENVIDRLSENFSVIILDVMMKISDKKHDINSFKGIPNPNGHFSGIILMKLINEHYKRKKNKPKIIFLTAKQKPDIEKYCAKNEYHNYYEKGVDNKLELFEEVKKLSNED